MFCADKNFPRLLLLESLLLCLLLSAFHLTGGLVAAGSEWPDVLYSGQLESSGGDDDFFIVVMIALRLVFTAIAFFVKRGCFLLLIIASVIDVLCLMLVAETSDLTMTARDNMFFAIWCIGFIVLIANSLVLLARKLQ